MNGSIRIIGGKWRGRKLAYLTNKVYALLLIELKKLYTIG